MPSALDLRGVSKTFPGQVALDDVSLRLQPGEIHALVGQNGSGKSTLVKILAGYHHADPGAEATVAGVEFHLGDPHSARRAGLRFVHQDLGLVETLNAAENIALGLGFSTGFAGHIRWKVEHRRTAAAMAELSFSFDTRAPVGELSVAQRTEVALVRAIRDFDTGARVLVLDEPTAALPADDVHRLFESMRRLRDRGMALLFVSHHLDEVLAIADSVTVLRDGRHIATQPMNEVNREQLVSLIVGRAVTPRAKRHPVDVTDGYRLEIQGMAGSGLAPFDLRVLAGEVIGVAGLEGSGREDVAGLVFGDRPRAGVVTLDGRALKPNNPRASWRAGMAFVPADRAQSGLVASMGVRENLTLADVRRNCRGMRLSLRQERAETRSWIERLNVMANGPDAPITALSGGNQQKVLLARGLRLAPTVLVLDNPTQGVDVGGKEEIHSMIDDAASAGAAVVVTSTDSEELVRVCHRVIVLRRGAAVVELRRGVDLTIENIDHQQLATVAS